MADDENMDKVEGEKSGAEENEELADALETDDASADNDPSFEDMAEEEPGSSTDMVSKVSSFLMRVVMCM